MQDLDNNVSYVNRAFTRVYGYEPDEIVGRHASMVDSHTHPRPSSTRSGRRRRPAGRGRAPIVNRRKDGSVFEVEAVISGIKDANGRVIGYMQTDRDVTRERALESALEREARERESIEIHAGPHRFVGHAGGDRRHRVLRDRALLRRGDGVRAGPRAGRGLGPGFEGPGAELFPTGTGLPPRNASSTCGNEPPADPGSRRWQVRPAEYDVPGRRAPERSCTAGPMRRSPAPATRIGVIGLVAYDAASRGAAGRAAPGPGHLRVDRRDADPAGTRDAAPRGRRPDRPPGGHRRGGVHAVLPADRRPVGRLGRRPRGAHPVRGRPAAEPRVRRRARAGLGIELETACLHASIEASERPPAEHAT